MESLISLQTLQHSIQQKILNPIAKALESYATGISEVEANAVLIAFQEVFFDIKAAFESGEINNSDCAKALDTLLVIINMYSNAEKGDYFQNFSVISQKKVKEIIWNQDLQNTPVYFIILGIITGGKLKNLELETL